MPAIFAVVGLIVGGSFAGFRFALIGGVLGFLFGQVLALGERMRALTKTVDDLKRRIDTLGRAAPETQRPIVEPRPQPTPAAPKVAPQPPREQAGEARQFEAPKVSRPAAERPAMAGPMTAAAPVAGTADHEFAPLRWLREFFTGGNTVVRVSIAILFVGVALLLQYASERGAFPIEVRLIAVALGAMAMLAVGWRLRAKRFGYAIALQGGATALLYLVIFAALRAYALLPASLAFALLLAVVVLSAALAVLQNAQWLALLGIAGGFLAPILTSTGQGSHIALFTFYAALNVGVIAIAWFKAWRPLNVLGFAFTFVIGSLWGVQRYVPEYFASTEPFLVLFFLMYVAIAVLFASRQPPNLKGYVDGTIVFGTPIAAFALQSALLYERRYWLAFSALIVSVLYLSLAWTLWRRRASWRLLAESFVALSVAFATLAIPLALNGRWSAATWALEGAALVWVGCRQSQFLPRFAGVALQFAAALMFLRDRGELFTGLAVLNSSCLGALIIAGGGLYCSKLLHDHIEKLHPLERVGARALFFWALFWWLVAGVGEIERWAPENYTPHALLAFFAATAFLSSEVNRRVRIEIARLPALWLLPIMLAFVVIEWLDHVQPFAYFGWLAWPFCWAVFYLTLNRHEGAPEERATLAMHVGGVWLLATVLSREVEWLINYFVAGAGSWPAIAWALVPATLLLLSRRLTQWFAWPLQKHENAYVLIAGGGLALYLVAWSLVTSIARSGDPYPLPYAPFLNPLDLAQAAVLLAGLTWLRRQRALIGIIPDRNAGAVVGIVGFAWLNAILLRTIHYYGGVPYMPDALWHSTLVQTSLSIFWTALALTTMLLATRRGARWLWWIGALLMAIVVAKLFFVDLSRIGSIARIVSFIGVGLLMLIVGYFSPLPPQEKAAAT